MEDVFNVTKRFLDEYRGTENFNILFKKVQTYITKIDPELLDGYKYDYDNSTLLFMIKRQIFYELIIKNYPTHLLSESWHEIWPEIKQPTKEINKYLDFFRKYKIDIDINLQEPLVLYRGSCEGAAMGLSWTRDKVCAEWFAYKSIQGTNRKPILYKTIATADMVLGHFSSHGEDEFVLDINKLINVKVDIADITKFAYCFDFNFFDKVKEQLLRYEKYQKQTENIIKSVEIKKLLDRILETDVVKAKIEEWISFHDYSCEYEEMVFENEPLLQKARNIAEKEKDYCEKKVEFILTKMYDDPVGIDMLIKIYKQKANPEVRKSLYKKAIERVEILLQEINEWQ